MKNHCTKEVRMLQAVLEQPEKVSFKEVHKPKPSASKVLIKVKRIGICGSDIHAYYGKHPYIKCPIVQGHEFSGQIVEIGESVKGLKVGENVTVMPQLVCGRCYPCSHGNYNICNELRVIGCQAEGAAQEYIAVEASLVVELPRRMSYEEGAMVEPVAVGTHAVSRLGSVRGLNILVLGAGPIGNLTAQVAKGKGAKAVMITDVSDYRLKIAQECGIDFALNPTRSSLLEALQTSFGDSHADAIMECVGVEETIGQAIQVARKGTDIIVVGVFGKRPTVDIGQVQDKELRLIGTLMYKQEDYQTAIRLIRSGRINLNPLMSKHFPFKEYGQAYEFIEQNRDKTMKVFIEV